MKEPLVLTEKERDIFLSLILKELREVRNYGAVAQAYLDNYKEDLSIICNKLVANMEE